MIRLGKILCLSFLILCLTGSGLQARSPQTQSDVTSIGGSFENPQGLRPAVEFWKKIYTRYTTRQSVIHDNKHLNIVYTAIDFTDLHKNPDLTDDQKRRIREDKTEEVKDAYRALLGKLDRVDMEEIPVSKLDAEELRVYKLFANVTESYRFDIARGRLRSQVGQKNEFMRGIKDSGGYLSEMERIFRSYGLPAQLTRLPFVESMFNTKAYSKAHASGIWQFIPQTGRLYLRIDNLADERNDPILSTHAAARLLLANYRALQSWPLALTAYNHGVSGMKRAVRLTGDTDLVHLIANYRHNSFGFASRNFYAQFLAAVEVERNYQRYFGEIKRSPLIEYDTLRIPEHVSLKTLCEYCRISEDQLIELNPALSETVINSLAYIPPDYDLKIPRGQKRDFLVAYANIPKSERHQLQHVFHWHRVQRGEALGQIAKQYRISVGELMRVNNLRRANRIYAGKLLKIPHKINYAQVKRGPKPKQFVEAARAPKAIVHYPEVKIVPLKREEKEILPATVVAPNDTAANSAVAALDPPSKTAVIPTTLASEEDSGEISSLFAVLDPTNNGKVFTLGFKPDVSSNHLGWFFHYQLTIPTASKTAPFSGYTIVTDGETPSHLAEWCQISTPQFRRLNHLKFGEGIVLGQKVKLECTNTQEKFHQLRIAFHQLLQEEFKKECLAVQMQTHVTKAADNLWDLSNNQYHTPIWMIQKHNPTRDLTKTLGEGVVLSIPTCTQMAKGGSSELSP